MKTFPSYASLAALLALLPSTPSLFAGTFKTGSNTFATAPQIDADQDYSGSDFSTATNLTAFNSQPGEPGHRPNNQKGAERTAWWRWKAPVDGYCTVDTLRTSEIDFPISDTSIAVYTGNAVNTLSLVGANDDHSAVVQPDRNLSKLTFFAKKDTIYHIAVDAYDSQEINPDHFNVILQMRLLELKKASRAAVHALEISPTGMGLVTVNTTATGGLSGKLTVGAKTYSFAGIFSIDGFFKASFAQKGPGNLPAPPLTLTIDGTGDGGFDLTAGNGKQTGGYLPRALVFTAQQPNPTTGSYALYMDHNSDPQVGGEGSVILKIKSTGAVTASGITCDGLPFTYSTAVYKRSGANHAELPAYRSFLAGKAAMLIASELNEAGEIDQIGGGTNVYLRTPVPAATFYPQGLAFSFDLKGSTYVKPAANHRSLGFLDGNSGDGFMTVTHSGDELQGNLFDTLNLSVKNKFVFSLTTHKPALTLNTSNGLVTGTVTEPGGKKRNIKAVLTYTNGEASIRGFATGTTRNIAVKVTP